MNYFLRATLCIMLLCLPFSFIIAQSAPEEILVCGGTSVLIIRNTHNKDSIPVVVWQWDARTAKSTISGFHDSLFQKIDECKPSEDGNLIMITASTGGGAALIEKRTKKVIFCEKVPNAHSIEALPDGLIAVAASISKEGNAIFIFNQKEPGNYLWKDSLYSAHGLVWNDKQAILYALGYTELIAYHIVNTGEKNVSLQRYRSWSIPGKGGHDLQKGPLFNEMIMTDEAGVFMFNTINGTFSPYAFLPDVRNIKSISFHPRTKQLLYTQATESWWTHAVQLLSPDKYYVFPSMLVYKARWDISNN